MNSFTMLLLRYVFIACIFTQAVAAAVYKPKTVIYWGQESDGKEKPLKEYCSSGDYDIIVLGFAYEFPTPSTHSSDYPALNFASHCETPYNSENPQLLICPGIAADINYCQSLGVQILLSFGGGVGRYGFSSDDQAVKFATLVWNMFMEGTGAIRPFGSTIIDGVDLDIEGGGTTGYIAFITQLRSYYATSSRKYYISSAPQCFYPDGRLGPGAGTALTGGWMDYVFVQFYNNYCGLEFTPYLSTPQFNFDVWAKWARTGSVNPNVKVFVGAPAASRAVGAGYVPIATLQSMVSAAYAANPDVYGGIMLWDASNSDNNGNFGSAVAAFVRSQPSYTSSSTPSVPSVPSVPSTPVTTGKSAPVTTGRSTPVTTGKPAPVTTAASVRLTTASIRSSAPGPILPPVVAPVTPPVVPSTPVPPVQSSSSSSSSALGCVTGHMKCLTSETYTMCDRNMWHTPQSCQTGLTCTPSGVYIYCI